MKFLVPTGGDYDERFAGTLTSYRHRGTPRAIQAGQPWAGDNCAFGKAPFNAARFRQWLITMRPYRATCRFIVVPDQVGDAHATLALWDKWADELADWPLAFVAQDGMEGLDWPTDQDFGEYYYELCTDTEPPAADDEESEPGWESEYGWQQANVDYWRECTPWTTLFVGGSTRWKLSEQAAGLIQEARGMGKRIHIGRVNWQRRYAHFARQEGSEDFTCDGTRTRFDKNAHNAWAGYQANWANYHSQLRMM